MTHDRSSYRPIRCEFHDLLEALAVTRKPSQIRFHDGCAGLQQRHAKVLDVFSRGGAEYVTISTDETLRLDQLVEVDGVELAGP